MSFEAFAPMPFAILLALVPTVVRLWTDRALARVIDEATLPERLLASRRRNHVILGVCGALIAIGWSSTVFWSIPLLVLANVVAAYPFRKRLHGETWSLWTYLGFFLRIVGGSFGFWILLSATPYCTGVWGTPDWLAPSVLAVVLLAWGHWSPELLLFLLRARPIADRALLSRFEAVVAAAGVPMPRFSYVDLRGGVVTNAAALPSLRQSTVVFTDSLLARLEPDEAVAICAHEVAHLEYYDRARLRRYAAANAALILTGALYTPLMAFLPSSVAPAIEWLWPFAVVANVVWRSKDRQRNETTSDLRAVALTGNAEAMATALAKLYAWNRFPRRLDRHYEQQATHPSLARRIRDIRRAADTLPAPLPTAAVFSAAGGTPVVTFEPTRLRWTEGDAIEHSVSYGSLTEVRIQAVANKPARLLVVDRDKRRWEMTVASEDTARLQSVLDTVDGHIVHDTSAPRIGAVATRLVAILASMFALAIGQLACAFTALLVFLQPSARLAAAAGVTAAASALLSLRGTGIAPEGAPFVLAALAVGFLLLAFVKRDDPTTGSLNRALVLLGLASAIWILLVVDGGLSPVRLFRSVRSLPGAPALLFALAVALAEGPRHRHARRAAVACALAGITLTVIGSQVFLELAGRDPLLVRAEDVSVRALPGGPVTSVDVPFEASALLLSPQGQSMILWPEEDEDAPVGRDYSPTLHAGRIGGPLAALRADDAVFVDDDHVLTARFWDGHADVRELEIAPAVRELWRDQVDGAASGHLRFRPLTRRWELLGQDRRRAVVRAEGGLAPGATLMRWASPAPRAWLNALGVSNSSALVVEKRYKPAPFAGTFLRALGRIFPSPRSELEFWRVDSGGATLSGRSLLDGDCAEGVFEDQLVCTAFDGIRTRLAGVQTDSSRVVPIGTIAGHFATYGSRATNGWLTGWEDSTLLALRVQSREAVRVPNIPGMYVRAIAATDAAIGTIESTDTGSRIRIYRLPFDHRSASEGSARAGRGSN